MRSNFACNQGRNDGGNGGTIPRAPNHYGGAESLRGAPKKSQVNSLIQYIYFRNNSDSNIGALNVLFDPAPSNLVTPLRANRPVARFLSMAGGKTDFKGLDFFDFMLHVWTKLYKIFLGTKCGVALRPNLPVATGLSATLQALLTSWIARVLSQFAAIVYNTGSASNSCTTHVLFAAPLRRLFLENTSTLRFRSQTSSRTFFAILESETPGNLKSHSSRLS